MVSISIIVGGTLGILGILGVALYPTMKKAPFAYGSARVRAARSKILKDEELKNLANESYKDVIYQLEKRGLTDLLQLLDADFREELVQRTLKQNYREELRKLTKYVPGQYRKFFKVLLSREEIDFVIAIIRSKVNPYYERHLTEEVFIDTENFSASELSDIRAMNLQDFIMRLKKTPYGETVTEYTEEIKSGELNKFERAINRNYFDELRKNSKHDPTLRKYAKLSIDITNIKSALTFKKVELIEGGSLSKDILNQLKEAKDIKEILTIIDKTKYGESCKECKNAKEITRALLRIKKNFGNSLSSKDPLSINPILAYFVNKKIELRNIAIILKLLSVNFDSKRIMENLI